MNPIQRTHYTIQDADTRTIAVRTASGPTRITWDELHAACEASESTHELRAIYRQMRVDAKGFLSGKYGTSWIYHDASAENRVMGRDLDGRRVDRRMPPAPGPCS